MHSCDLHGHVQRESADAAPRYGRKVWAVYCGLISGVGILVCEIALRGLSPPLVSNVTTTQVKTEMKDRSWDDNLFNIFHGGLRKGVQRTVPHSGVHFTGKWGHQVDQYQHQAKWGGVQQSRSAWARSVIAWAIDWEDFATDEFIRTMGPAIKRGQPGVDYPWDLPPVPEWDVPRNPDGSPVDPEEAKNDDIPFVPEYQRFSMRRKGEAFVEYKSRYPLHEVDPTVEGGDTDRWKVKSGYALAETWSLTPYKKQTSLTGEPLKPCNPMGLLDDHRGNSLENERYCKWEEGPFANTIVRNVCVVLPSDHTGHEGEWDFDLARKYARDPKSSTECLRSDTWARFLYRHLLYPFAFPSAPEIVCDSTVGELRLYFEEQFKYRYLAVEALDYIDQACGKHGVPPPEPAKIKFEASLGRRRRSEPVYPPRQGEGMLKPWSLRKKTDPMAFGLPDTSDYWPYDDEGNPVPTYRTDGGKKIGGMEEFNEGSGEFNLR